MLERETNKASGNDSVEGIAFSKDTSVIMTGQFVESDQVQSLVSDSAIFNLLHLLSGGARQDEQDRPLVQALVLPACADILAGGAEGGVRANTSIPPEAQ